MKVADVIDKVIGIAEAIRQYWEAELPKRYPNYPLVNEGEEDGPPPPEEAQLRALLEGLPEDVLYKLLFVASLGRGVVALNDVAGQYEAMKERLPKRERVVSRLVDLAQSGLDEALTEGLDEARHHNIDVDHSNFASV